MEPWEGIPDEIYSDYDITHKRGIRCIDKNEEYVTPHTITVEG